MRKGRSTADYRSKAVRENPHSRVKATAAVVEPQPSADGPGAMEYGFWAFIFIAVGRINQLVPLLGILPLAKIVVGFTFLALLSGRRRLRPINPDARAIAKSAIGMLIIAVALTPFSFWRGASLVFLTAQLPVVVSGCVFAYFMCSSWKRLRGTFMVLVLCALVLARAAVSGYSGGRADDAGTMYDPNDLAYVLVTIIPLAIAFFLSARSMRARVLFGITLATLIGATLLTQSRGGLLGLLTVTALVTFAPMKINTLKSEKSSGRGLMTKLGILAVIVCIGAVVWTQLPHSAQARFSTLLNLSSDYNLDPNDRNGRGAIWLRGIQAVSARPIGYGPQSYAMVDMSLGGMFNVAHNSLLQVLVELGVAGFVLFVFIYYASLRGLQRARSRIMAEPVISAEAAEQALFARALQISLAGNIVAGLFLAEAYLQALWITFGVCMALMTLASPGMPKFTRAGRS